MKKLILCLPLILLIFGFGTTTAQQTISGTITDANSQPIAGVNVVVKETKKGTTTDFDGNFSVVAETGQTVLFSYLGFKSQTLVIGDAKVGLEVTMAEDQLMLDQVVVTGVFNRKSLLESSVAITTMSAKEIEKVGFTSTVDILRSVPGVFVNSGNGEAENIIYSRGMSAAAGPSGAGYRYVSLTEDGLPVVPFTADGFTPDYFSRADITLSRVEAVRGGSASITSGNSPGGIFNYISKTGTNEFQGELRTKLGIQGEDGQSHARFDLGLGGPIGNNGLTYYVGGFYRYDNGMRNAPYPQNDGGQFKANLKKSWDRGYIKLGVKYLDDNILLNVSNFMTDWNNPKLAAGTEWNDNYVLPKFSYGIPDFRKLKDNKTATLPFDSSNRINVKEISANLEASFNLSENWSLTNNFKMGKNEYFANTYGLTSYLDPASAVFLTQFSPGPSTIFNLARNGQHLATVNNNFNGTGTFDPGSTLPLNLVGYFATFYSDSKADILQDQLSISGDLGDHYVTAGGYFSSSDYTNYSTSATFYGTLEDQPRPLQLIAPTPIFPGFSLDILGSDNKGVGSRSIGPNYVDVTTSTLAFFANDNFQINDKLNLDFGIRFEKLKHKGNKDITEQIFDQASGGLDGELLTGWDIFYEQSTGELYDIDFEYNTVSYSAGLNYLLSDQSALFVRYAKGNKAPWMSYHFSNDVIVNQKDGEVQKTDMAEIGYKINNSNISIFADVFYSRLGNILNQVTGFDPNEGGTYFTPAQFNTLRTFGLELEAIYRPFDNFNLRLTATVQDSKASEWKEWDIKSDQDSTNDELVDYSGNEGSNTPKVMLDLTPTLNFSKKGYVFANWRYLGARQANFANGFELPAFSEFKAGLGFDLNKLMSVQFNVNNIFNSHGLLRYSGSGLGKGGFVGTTKDYVANNPNEIFNAQPTIPRSYYVQLNFKF